MRINEWSVTDSSDAIKAMGEVNLRLPWVDAIKCYARHPSNLTCTRAEGHGGRHAATGSHGDVMAVWS